PPPSARRSRDGPTPSSRAAASRPTRTGSAIPGPWCSGGQSALQFPIRHTRGAHGHGRLHRIGNDGNADGDEPRQGRRTARRPRREPCGRRGVGGDPAKVQTVAPYLERMGRRHMYAGGAGMANRVKLIHNGLGAVTSVAVAEALAVCVQSGVDPSIFYEVVRNGGGMAYGTYFERRAKRVLDGDFTPTFALELMRN